MSDELSACSACGGTGQVCEPDGTQYSPFYPCQRCKGEQTVSDPRIVYPVRACAGVVAGADSEFIAECDCQGDEVDFEVIKARAEAIAAALNEVASLRRQVAELRGACAVAQAFIENLRVPQTVADAGLQIFKATGVMDSLRAALADTAEKQR